MTVKKKNMQKEATSNSWKMATSEAKEDLKFNMILSDLYTRALSLSLTVGSKFMTHK